MEGQKAEVLNFAGDEPMQASKYMSQEGRGELAHAMHEE